MDEGKKDDSGNDSKEPDKNIPKDLDFTEWDLSNIDAESTYSPFNEELDKIYPVDTMLLEENKRAVLADEIEPLKWVSIFRSSPAQMGEAEMYMGTVVKLALQAGQWIDTPMPKDENLGEVILPGDITLDFTGVKLEFERGIEKLEEIGFVKKIVDDDGRTWVKPQRKMILFFKERLKSYGPKKDK